MHMKWSFNSERNVAFYEKNERPCLSYVVFRSPLLGLLLSLMSFFLNVFLLLAWFKQKKKIIGREGN